MAAVSPTHPQGLLTARNPGQPGTVPRHSPSPCLLDAPANVGWGQKRMSPSQVEKRCSPVSICTDLSRKAAYVIILQRRVKFHVSMSGNRTVSNGDRSDVIWGGPCAAPAGAVVPAFLEQRWPQPQRGWWRMAGAPWQCQSRRCPWRVGMHFLYLCKLRDGCQFPEGGVSFLSLTSLPDGAVPSARDCPRGFRRS